MVTTAETLRNQSLCQTTTSRVTANSRSVVNLAKRMRSQSAASSAAERSGLVSPYGSSLPGALLPLPQKQPALKVFQNSSNCSYCARDIPEKANSRLLVCQL